MLGQVDPGGRGGGVAVVVEELPERGRLVARGQLELGFGDRPVAEDADRAGRQAGIVEPPERIARPGDVGGVEPRLPRRPEGGGSAPPGATTYPE